MKKTGIRHSVAWPRQNTNGKTQIFDGKSQISYGKPQKVEPAGPQNWSHVQIIDSKIVSTIENSKSSFKATSRSRSVKPLLAIFLAIATTASTLLSATIANAAGGSNSPLTSIPITEASTQSKYTAAHSMLLNRSCEGLFGLHDLSSSSNLGLTIYPWEASEGLSIESIQASRNATSNLPAPNFIQAKLQSEHILRLFSYTPPANGTRYAEFPHAKFLLEKPKEMESWGANQIRYRNVFAIEGDPTWNISIMGQGLASFFDIKLIHNTLMQIPTLALVSARIRLINELLVARGYEPIPILLFDESITENQPKKDPLPLTASTFGEPTSPIQTSSQTSPQTLLQRIKEKLKTLPLFKSPPKIGLSYAENFVRRFQTKSEIPYEVDEIVHDASFHLTSLLLTESQLKPIKGRCQIAIELADFLRDPMNHAALNKVNRTKLLTSRRTREVFLKLLFQSLSIDIDNLSPILPFKMAQWDVQNNQKASTDDYQLYNIQLGIDYQAYFGPAANGPIGDWDFTLGHWLNLRTETLKQLIQRNHDLLKSGHSDVSIKWRSIEYLFKVNKLNSDQRRLVQAAEPFMKELKITVGLFLNQSKTAQAIVAKYDARGDVIAGMAPSGRAIPALQRRIKEMNEVLGIQND